MFSQIIGHEEEKKKLTSLLQGDFSGTYLFRGPPSTGKRTVAFETAKVLLCEKGEGDTCTCRSCKKFGSTHPDFLCIGREKIKVDDIDHLLDFFSIVPFMSNKKVVILDNADNITWEASNRLLKVLEEPPPGFVSILVSSNPEAMLPTVLYRCIQVDFKALSKGSLVTIISKKLGFEVDQALALASIASFSVVDIFSNAGQYIHFRNLAVEFVSAMKHKALIDLMDFLDKIDKADMPLFADMLVLVLTDILLLQNDVTDIVNKDIEKTLHKFLKSFNAKAVIGIVNVFSQVKRNAYLNVNMNMVMKNALIKSYPIIAAMVAV